MIYYLLISLLFITAPNAFARDITVDINGKGDFTSVQEAINSVRAFDPAGWATIHIKKGVYKEKVEIPTYNTKASCGRYDPAWKHRLNEIPIAESSINER